MNAFIIRVRENSRAIMAAVIEECRRRISRTTWLFLQTTVGASFLAWAIMDVPFGAIMVYWGLFASASGAYALVQEAESDWVTAAPSKACLYAAAMLFLVMGIFMVGRMVTHQP